MRFVVTLRDGSPAGSQTEVLVDAEPGSPFSELLPHLLAAFDDGTHPSFASGVQVWVDGVPIEAPEQHTLVSAGLRPGAIVELHAAHERADQQPSGIAEIRVVNGPGSGRVHRLPLGHTVIGFDAPGMALADRQLPGHALTVIATAGGQVDAEPVAGVAATLDGEEISARRPWPLGGYLVAGQTVLELAPVSPALPAAPAGSQQLTVAVLRPPRPPVTPPGGWPATQPTGPDAAQRAATQENAPGGRAEAGRLPAAANGSAGGQLDDAGQGRSSSSDERWARTLDGGQQLRAERPAPRTGRIGRRWLPGGSRHPSHRQDKARASAAGQLAAGPEAAPATVQPAPRPALTVVEQARARRHVVPDPASLLLSTVARDATVWRRFPSDEDFLRLRIGLGDQDGLPEVPVWADLASIGVLGICGDQDVAHALAAWLLAQCAVLHSPRQVRLAVLTTNQYQARRRWEWLVRVPHSDPGGVATADDDPEPPVSALIGADEESTDRRLAELSALIADRRLTAATSTRSTPPLPRIVVLLDGARRLRGRPGLSELLSDGPDAGVYTICLDEDENWLPPGCREVIACGPREARLSHAEVVRPDQVEPAWTDQVSRLLSPLRDASPVPGQPATQQAGLLPMLGLADPKDRVRAIEAQWRGSPSGRVVIGAGHDGPFAVDLRLDGPHLLVAGEPASRPDALLAVVIASLAAANRPDDLNAILISIGPGGELAGCAALPHVSGTVEIGTSSRSRGQDDREEPLQRLQRALAGLSAELDRRDALLSRAGARDLEDYAARGTRLPRLLVAVHDVVDLAEQLPEGLAELVTAAQRGESLGLNLLLGTARPQDIASHEIASVLSANATLRICLRVQTEAASRAIIDASEAARIPRRAQGRGFARTGHWPLLSFRMPRLGPPARSLSTAGAQQVPGGPLAWALPWDDAGHPAPGRLGEQAAGGDPLAAPLATELAELAAATQSAAQALMIAPAEPPWLPPLPPVVVAAALRSQLRPATVDLTDPVVLPHPWALEEHPESQSRSVASIELGHSGHLLLAGAAGSGRSTALRTITGTLADRVSSADLHIYGIDCGDGALAAIGELPHTGALVKRAERARAGKVLSQLIEEVAARREALSTHGWADVDEQRAVASSDDRLPYLLLVIDRWETLIAGPDGGTLSEQVLLLLRRGVAAGLQVVIAGDRSLLSGRISALALPCLLLRPDGVDYGLAGLNPARHPALLPPGRGVWADSGVQVQVSVLSPDASSAAQIAAVEDIARRRARRNATIPDTLRPVRL